MNGIAWSVPPWYSEEKNKTINQPGHRGLTGITAVKG